MSRSGMSMRAPRLGVDGRFGLGAMGSGGSSPTLWTPENGGAILWWDAGTTASAGSWTDRIGGKVAAGGAGSGYSATARNSKPGLTFNGSQYLQFDPAGLPLGGSARAIGIVGYSTAGAGLYAFSYGNNASQQFLGFVDGAALGVYNGDTGNVAAENWNANDRAILFRLDGAGSGAWNIDGKASEAFSYATNTNLVAGTIGCYIAPGTAPFNGVVQQITIWDRDLTPGELAKWAGWQSWWTGKSGADLPIGSPYKTRAPYVTDSLLTLVDSAGAQLFDSSGQPLELAA